MAALLALVGCVALVIVAYIWVLPWIATVGAERLPPEVGRTLTVQTLKVLDGGALLPSRLSIERQRTLIAKFHALRLPEGGTPQSVLLFRASPQIGANAFTLPDGTIVLLDDLVNALGNDEQVLAVLSHELGHAHGRHGLRLLLQSSVTAAFWTLYIGDISQMLAAAPAAVLQARYSQAFEREADDYGAALLRYNGLSPALLARALETLSKTHPDASKAGYLASHPSTVERIRHLEKLSSLDK